MSVNPGCDMPVLNHLHPHLHSRASASRSLINPDDPETLLEQRSFVCLVTTTLYGSPTPRDRPLRHLAHSDRKMDPDQLSSRSYGRYSESSKYERNKIPGYDNFGHASIMSSGKTGHLPRGTRYDELPDASMPRPTSLFPSAGPTGKRGSRACVSCMSPYQSAD